jgi:hypothetical protein
MKFMSVIILMTTVFASTQALASGAVVDIYPEVLVLDDATTTALTAESIDLANGISNTLYDVACTRQNGFSTGVFEVNCVLNVVTSQGLTQTITFDGDAALALYSKLKVTTAEPDLSGQEDGDPARTGKRVSAVLISELAGETTVSIPYLVAGRVSCGKATGKTRCEIELNELSGFIVSK